MPSSLLPDPAAIDSLRAFNRFYTQRIGILDPYLGSEFSLTEVRVLYELAHHGPCTASGLIRRLALDRGYLSRIVQRFEREGWIQRSPCEHDARQHLIALTDSGHTTFEPLQQRSREEVATLLAPLDEVQRKSLLSALGTVRNTLASAHSAHSAPGDERTARLRAPEPGDMGWVIEQHGALYAAEYGWNRDFEALVARIVAEMMERHDPNRDAGWIAELDGQRVGSAFVVRREDSVAQLRLLIVRPEARGLGLGARLTDACIDHARNQGYRTLTLWTNQNLTAARSIYARRGFRLMESEPHHSYGHDLVGEQWELVL